MIQIKIKKLNPEAIIPKYAHPGDAGLDLCSCENYILGPGERGIFGTGLSIEIPSGYVGLFWDKSGVGAKGIKVLGGVADCHYRGEYKVILTNLSKENYTIEKGNKIAQLLIQPIETAEIIETDGLTETARGSGGFGSTGIQ